VLCGNGSNRGRVAAAHDGSSVKESDWHTARVACGALLGIVLLVLAVTQLPTLQQQLRHNQLAYHTLASADPGSGVSEALTLIEPDGARQLDQRTLWLWGRHLLQKGEPSLALEPLRKAAAAGPDDYQTHRDLLYAVAASAKSEEFIREYERGQALRERTALGAGAYAQSIQSLAPASFDLQDPQAEELVLVSYIGRADQQISDGNIQGAAVTLSSSMDLFGANVLVLTQVRALCQADANQDLCSTLAQEWPHQVAWAEWQDARLTVLMAGVGQQLLDVGQWGESEALALARYLVWKHSDEEATQGFLSEASDRGLTGAGWSDLRRELEKRRAAAQAASEATQRAVVELEGGNLLERPGKMLTDIEHRSLPLGEHNRWWRFGVIGDWPPGQASGYVGGVDGYACSDDAVALRVDGQWSDPASNGPPAGVAFESNEFYLGSGQAYELRLNIAVGAPSTIAQVAVEFLPSGMFGPQSVQTMRLSEGSWAFTQRLIVGPQGNAAARVRVRFRGYGPMWLCSPTLSRVNGDRTSEAAESPSADYPVQTEEPVLRCMDCPVIGEYVAHRDLLYQADREALPDQFVREYDEGTALRALLRELFRLENILVRGLLLDALGVDRSASVQADMLPRGSFDPANPSSSEAVLANYLSLVDAALDSGQGNAAGSRLATIEALVRREPSDLLIAARAYLACRMDWQDARCDGASDDETARFRLEAWDDARLTDFLGRGTLSLWDAGVLQDQHLLSVGRYLVWQHSIDAATQSFLNDAASRGLDSAEWAELVEDLTRRRDTAGEGEVALRETVQQVQGNLLALPARWRVDIRDQPPYGGGSYVAGLDAAVCPNGTSALRVDGLWQAPHSGGPVAWAGLESNAVLLQPGAVYDLAMDLRVLRSKSAVRIQLLPESIFGSPGGWSLALEDSRWITVHQELTVHSRKEVTATIRLRYAGTGPFWVCDPRLVCRSCGEATPSVDVSANTVSVSEPDLTCADCGEP